MSVTMKPVSTIEARLKIQPKGAIHKYFTMRCKDHMQKFVPMLDKNLRNSARLEGPDIIVYSTPYAHYQYMGMREDGTHIIKRWTTPGTGPYWDKRMWSAKKDTIIQEVEKVIGRDIT